ncbi:MAG: SPOR domain-containing protein [Candidatus Aminicenantes bacterium]|nr:SPOR domain-containing protein [Candidatus Aminicenantes bacterium]
MGNKDYRELQVSSTHLVVIFIGILIVCGVSFLLGVNVGKRKAQLEGQSSLPAPQVLSKIQDPAPAESVGTSKTETPDKKAAKPPAQGADAAKTATQAKPDAATPSTPDKKTAKPAATKPSAASSAPLTAAKGTFSIQVGAFEKREDALLTAKKFDGQGYICRVLDPFPGERVRYFRVRIGAFKTRAEAAAARDTFVSGGGKDYFIVQN